MLAPATFPARFKLLDFFKHCVYSPKNRIQFTEPHKDEKAFSFCALAHTVNAHKPAPFSFPKPHFILTDGINSVFTNFFQNPSEKNIYYFYLKNATCLRVWDRTLPG